jgi:Dyp-type peroxidase family
MSMATLDLEDIQGIVARGYGNLRAARYLLLALDDPDAAGRWLGSLASALTNARTRPAGSAVNVALTAQALDRLGLPARVLAGFAPEFVEGMAEGHRSRLLGDAGENAPDGWRWGGPATAPIDVLLMLYGAGMVELDRRHQALVGGIAAAGVRVVETLDTADLDNTEHFGFNDGISQPPIDGLAGRDRAARFGPERPIRAGEFLLGYRNEYGQYTDRPLLPRSDDPGGLLPLDAAHSGRADLGRNGTYLVFRQLRQDVRGFWRFVEAAARRHFGTDDLAAQTYLAAKMVGRWPDGAPLVKAPDRTDEALSTFNDFGYLDTDPYGFRCPISAHIRRAHPRDSLRPGQGMAAPPPIEAARRALAWTVETLQNAGGQRPIDVSRLHRLLRRGREYGPPVPPEERWSDPPDGATEPERGLYFICLNANLGRQFEFVQGTWLNNPKFDGLYDETDPLVGNHDAHGNTFSIPATPIRHRITGLPQFVTVRGGGYFFLPGLRALRYIASRAWADGSVR